jgi:RNA polymerase sigma-32 factor
MSQKYSDRYGVDNHALIRTAMAAPMLEKAHELDLARRWRDNRDTHALADLTRSYLRLVISMARRFRHYGLQMADLVQEGSVGLMEAAARFEHERDLRFSTYASWWIRAAMQDYVLRNWSIVRTGTTSAHKSLFFNLRRVKAQIAGENSADENDVPLGLAAREALAKRLGVRVKDVEIMDARLSAGDRSLNVMVGDDGDSEFQDFLTCDAPRPDEVLEESNAAVVSARIIQEAMASLTAREKQIITARKLGEEPITLASLGQKLGISKERVRQIENQAIAKIKNAILIRVKDPVQAGLVGSMA